LEALREVHGSPWWRDQVVWLYRGAWQEWEAHEIDMAVPFSPQEVQRKTEAIWYAPSRLAITWLYRLLRMSIGRGGEGWGNS
jgi:hypothetical protein